MMYPLGIWMSGIDVIFGHWMLGNFKVPIRSDLENDTSDDVSKADDATQGGKVHHPKHRIPNLQEDKGEDTKHTDCLDVDVVH
jgi:hypothetical protein